MLEAVRVARPSAPVVVLVVQASRLHVQPGRPHHKTCRIGLPCVGQVSRLPGGWSAFRIPNSEFAYAGFARRENTTTKTQRATSVMVPMISPGMPSKA